MPEWSGPASASLWLLPPFLMVGTGLRFPRGVTELAGGGVEFGSQRGGEDDQRRQARQHQCDFDSTE